MSPSLTEVAPQTAGIPNGSTLGLQSVPVEWTSTAFECSVLHVTASAGDAATAAGPVRLRVDAANAGSCKVEIFCAAGWLCRVSAGY